MRKPRASTKGKLFTFVERYDQITIGDSSSETVEYVECDGREAAVKARRKLLVKHAQLFGETTKTRVRLYPEIERPRP